jgi:tRNA threonylcarbamoyladenosine biosynthesis protein TsaE
LYGDLGSGKTTFTAFLVHALGIDRRVQSPTFVILRKYSAGSDEISTVNHFDFYRIQDENELYDLGLEEIFGEPNAIAVIEWPKVAESFLPKNIKKMQFEYIDEEERRINVPDFD